MTLRKTTLADGTEVSIQEIEAYDTYREWVIGMPGPLTKHDKHREGWMPEGRGLEVLDHPLYESSRPGVKRSPWYTVITLLNGPSPEKDSFGYGSLKVVWLVDEVPDNLLDGLCEAIHGLVWSDLAIDVMD